MEAHRNQTSDNHEKSQNCVNYPHSNDAVSATTEANSEQQIQLRRCKSEASAQKLIDIRMGVRVSRSHSADSIVDYEPLSQINLLVNREDNDDDDDYKLLDSSSDDGIELNVLNNDNNCDGQTIDNTCTTISSSEQQQLNVSRAVDNNCESVIRTKFSTLPRIKKSRDLNDTRRSLHTKATINFNDMRVEKSEEVAVKLANNSETVDDSNMRAMCKSDKTNESQFCSTTLPKARSRLSDSLHFRHSLRFHSIDSDRKRRHLSEVHNNNAASGNNHIAILANAGESTSGTSE